MNDRDASGSVLFVNNRAGVYGSERSLYEMARALRKFTPHVLLPEEGPLATLLRDAGVRLSIHDLRDEQPGGRPEGERLSWLERFIENNEVDILHVNKTSCPVRLCRQASWALRIPMLVHVRAEVPIPCRDRFHFSRADRHVFVSESARRYILDDPVFNADHPISADRTHVVADGRKLEDYDYTDEKRRSVRSRLGLRESDLVVAIVGFIDPSKGQDRFLELARRLLGVNGRFKFLIIGDLLSQKSRQFKEDIRREIAGSPLRDSVFLTGVLDCGEAYSAVDITVSLSQSEGLPGALIEAMASRNVVVANAVGGIPDIIGCDGAGYCVDRNDLESMCRIILRLSENEGEREKIGARARRRVERRYSSERCAALIEGLYEEVLRDRQVALRE